MQSSSWSSVRHNGGANRMISPCVGFANSPFSFNRRHTSHASRPAILIFNKKEIFRIFFQIFISFLNLRLSITMAFNNPLPRTIVTISFGNLRSSDRNFSPKR